MVSSRIEPKGTANSRSDCRHQGNWALECGFWREGEKALCKARIFLKPYPASSIENCPIQPFSTKKTGRGNVPLFKKHGTFGVLFNKNFIKDSLFFFFVNRRIPGPAMYS
ncbi:hypothetical protein ACWGPW_08260 [Paenibacillus chitinolyticus]